MTSFFRQTTDLTLYVQYRLFNRFKGTQRSRVRVAALVRNFFVHLRNRTRLKGFSFEIVLALCDFFLLFFVSKVSSFSFFDILQQTGISRSPKGPFFYNFWHCELCQKDYFSVDQRAVSELCFFKTFFQNYGISFYRSLLDFN